MPQTTRKELEAAIDEGGSVIIRGQHIFSKENLPTEDELRALHRTPSSDGSAPPAAEHVPPQAPVAIPAEAETPPKGGKKD